MQEFSSISVSSYEAGSLAERLTEQSGDGWSVVAIVPTGSTVTAYLSRDAASDADGSSASPATATASAAMLVGDEAADAAVEPVETTDAPAVEADAPAVDPVDEPAGWASSTATTEPETPSATGITAATETDAAPAAVASTPSEPSESSTTTAAAAGGAAPAGWYADPSSRFELRYWDGSQWTEHVSRAGQQYTDPPVA